jgi:glycosyltransferase involved in cell wall biosynthesis
MEMHLMQTPERLRIAMVVQRYGLEVSGGAELHCRWLAEHLNQYYDVRVITTCALDYARWENHYPPGRDEVNGIQVHRFRVDRRRDPKRFGRLTVQLLGRPHAHWDELEWMRQQGPLSTGLSEFVRRQRSNYDVFIFFTYLYATTYFGLQLVPDKAVLVPTAHDEPVIYLSLFRPLFNLPRLIVYNTEVERRFVERLSGNYHVPSAVVGVGIDLPADLSGERFRQKYDLDGDFVAYVGRVDSSKNCDELLDHFLRFRQGYAGDLKLVVMGKGSLPVPQHPDVVPLGFVSEQDKFDGLQAASVVVIPSHYESLSMAMLEAWLAGTPVLVNGECEVLKEQCRRSNGGLYYHSYQEFELGLSLMLTREGIGDRLAEAGRRFARENYSWSIIEQKYQALLPMVTIGDSRGGMSN